MAIHQGHHVDAKGVLELSLLVEIVQHNLRDFTRLQFNDQAHAGFVRLVLNMTDAFNFLFVHQFSHALLQRLFIDLIGQFIHDDGLTLTFVDVFKMAFGAHHDASASSSIPVFHAIDAVNNTGRWKVRRRHNGHEVINRGVWVF